MQKTGTTAEEDRDDGGRGQLFRCAATNVVASARSFGTASRQLETAWATRHRAVAFRSSAEIKEA